MAENLREIEGILKVQAGGGCAGGMKEKRFRHNILDRYLSKLQSLWMFFLVVTPMENCSASFIYFLFGHLVLLILERHISPWSYVPRFSISFFVVLLVNLDSLYLKL